MSGVSLALVLLALALGAFSAAMFVWQWIAGSAGVAATSILSIAVLIVFGRIFLALRKRIPFSPSGSDSSWIVRVPIVCMLIGAGYAAVSLVQHFKTMPHGAWDAWAVWNLHARFLYRGSSGAWLKMFDPIMAGSKPDYPLLVPGLVSSAWRLADAESPEIAAFVAAGFAALATGILCTSVSALTKDERGWLAGLTVLATPTFLWQTASQASDIPISVYMLSTAVLLRYADAWPAAAKPFLILSGLSAGLAAWTKDEGLLFVVALLASLVALLALQRDWRGLHTRIMPVLLGLAPMLALLAAFKLLLAPATSTIAPATSTIEQAGHAASVVRYKQVALGFIDQAKGFGGTWHTGGIHPSVLVLLFLLLYAKPAIKITRTSQSLALVIGFMLAGYFMVYMFSESRNVSGYIGGSLDRLYLQLWPVCLFLVATFQSET